jgi:hypothetical protein
MCSAFWALILGMLGRDPLDIDPVDIDPAVFGDEEVLRLQIAMDDALLMRGSKAASDLHSVVDRLAHGKAAALDLLAQGLALQQLGDEIQRALADAHLRDSKNVGVVQSGCGTLATVRKAGAHGEQAAEEFDEHDGVGSFASPHR